ncbi:MAG: CoA transferase [Streptosporangiales bacterium]|nr:CoA transferase [Streptosporangiales bacterium]
MRPLDGITVVAMEQAVAAPFATRQLADLGARVIKLERPGSGDFARSYDHAVRGEVGAHFVWLNRSKESVCLDLKAAPEVLHDLLEGADVFLANLAPGALDRLGFGTEELLRRYPRLIIVNITGYGTSGPYARKKAYDLLVQCETGLTSVTGNATGQVKTGIPAADIAAGMYAFSGVLAALRQRDLTGKGLSVDVSMFDALAEWMGYPMYHTMHTGADMPLLGLGHPSVVPYDAFPTRDGEVLIGVQNDRQWAALARDVLGRPDLVDHPDYATNVARCAKRELTDTAVREGTSRMTSAELIEALERAGVPNAGLKSVKDFIDHPQLSERDRWRSVGTPAGEIDALLPTLIMSGVEPRMDAVPELGHDTDAVLAELGYDEDRIRRMREEGAA